MKWTTPQYRSGEVDKAGDTLAAGTETDHDLEIINNWRASHSFPLQIIKMMLRSRARSADKKALVSQRLKRLPSIQNKLRREGSMRASQVQDIGGCRAVLSDIAAVDRLVELFRKGLSKNPKGRHLYGDPKDHVAQPKNDGYRGFHYTVRYQTTARERLIYNGKKIEIQIRSKLQHAWATAVETVDALTGRSLKFDVKSNIEDPRWKRFFALMGSAIAFREKRPPVPNTPSVRADLVSELSVLAEELHVENVLGGFSVAVNILDEKRGSKAAEYILILNANDKSVSVMQFDEKQRILVDAEYLRQEKLSQGQAGVQVVRVSVEDIRSLRAAYPNYYLDTSLFIDALRAAVSQKISRSKGTT